MRSMYLRKKEIVFLLIIAALLAGCSGSAQAAGSPEAAQTPEGSATLPPVRSNSSVMAEGRVVPAQEAQLSFSTGGVVDEVLVAEGEMVEAGQVIVRLKGNEKLKAAVAAAELELLSAQQALEALKANADVVRADTLVALAEARRQLDKAEKRTYSKDYQRGDQELIDTARANYIIAEDGVKQATILYDQVDDRPEDDPVRAEAFSQLAAARQRRDVALANLNYLLSKPNELDVAEIDAQLAQAQARVADLERQLELLADGPDKNQLALAEARVKNAQANLESARSSLKDLELSAPFAGQVVALDISRGESVSPGVAVAQIADVSTWFVETTDLNEMNITRVQPGQPAMVRFDAVPGLEIIGRVTKIKAIGENRQGDIVYTVVLRLEAPDERLRWNMTASLTFLEKETNQ